MCGRYTQHQSTDQVVIRFEVDEVLHETNERYNIAPTQLAPVVLQPEIGGPRILDAFRWGLVPFWAKDPSIGNRLLNARVETVAEKPSFRSALSKRRCLVVADGYYEWRTEGKTKQPIYYLFKDEPLFAFAGIWENWKQEDGEVLHSFTIITTTPNELAARAHDRMPAILKHEDEALWLDCSVTDTELLLSKLSPYPTDAMHCYEVSQRVNKPRDDDAGLIHPLTIPANASTDLQLFDL